MRVELFLLVVIVAACGLSLLVAEDADAQVDLNYTDDRVEKVALGLNPVQFNFTVKYTGIPASAEIDVQLEGVPPLWNVFFVAYPLVGITTGTYSPSYPFGFLMTRNETCTLTVIITPAADALNQTYWFNLTVYPKATPEMNESFAVGVVIPHKAGFSLILWDPPPDDAFLAIPPYTVTIRFALYNTGNGVDRFRVQGFSSLASEGWPLELVDGVDGDGLTRNMSADPGKQRPLYIDVRVSMPDWADAGAETSVMVAASSVADPSLDVPPAEATFRALQYFGFQVFIVGPDSITASGGDEVSFGLSVLNQGNGPDTFTIEPRSDPGTNVGFVAIIDHPELTLERAQSGTVELLVLVPLDAHAKTYTFYVEVISSDLNLTSIVKRFHVEVPRVYGLELACEDNWRVSIPGAIVEFDVIVRNTGNGMDTFILGEITGNPSSWIVYIQPQQVTLTLNQTAVIKLIVICSTKQTYPPMMNYTMALPGKSTKGPAEASIDLFINFLQFWRIEWTYGGEDLTNPLFPATDERHSITDLVIDLLNQTSLSLDLGVINYGNGDDDVTVSMANEASAVDAQVSPASFHIANGETRNVTLTITVPSSITPGLYHLQLDARSSDEDEEVRSVILEFRAKAVYEEEDFASLVYTDAVGDDYLLVIDSKEAGGKVVESKGRLDRSAGVDIVGLEARHDHAAGTVTITLRFSGDVLTEPATEYWVFFVTSGHKQAGPLIHPEDHANGSFEWTFNDRDHTLCVIRYSNGTVDSPRGLQGLVAEVDGATLTITVPSRELRRVGVDPGSHFGLYAYAQTMVVAVDGEYRVQVDWDSAGVGASLPPEAFTNEREETPLPGAVAVLAIALAAVAVTFRRSRYPQRPPRPQ